MASKKTFTVKFRPYAVHSAEATVRPEVINLPDIIIEGTAIALAGHSYAVQDGDETVGTFPVDVVFGVYAPNGANLVQGVKGILA